MLLAVGLALAMPSLAAAQETRYLQPPEPLLQVFRAPLNPSPSLDPTGTRAILVRQSQYPPIARVAEPSCSTTPPMPALSCGWGALPTVRSAAWKA